MKKTTAVLIALFSAVIYVYSQANNQDDNTRYKDAATSGAVDIQTVPIEDFDDSSSWLGMMPRDMGIIRVQRREGGSAEVAEMEKGKDKRFCMGSKVAFFKTGANWFVMMPPKEVAIKGVSKELSIWACGRSFNHTLYAVVRDVTYNLYKLSFGKLNFPGWQKMTAQVNQKLDQENHIYISEENPRGLKLNSLLVECAMNETHGIYYLYVDDLVARADVFMENPSNRDPYDMIDTW
jgi:Flagellar filament outer layer protein Flaa